MNRPQAATEMTGRKLAFDAVPSSRKFRLRLARYAGMAEAIASYARAKEGAEPLRMLDVGPGSGRSLRFCEVAGVADRLRFWGVDNSERRLRTICEPSQWQLTFADVEQGLPYPSEYFDICVCEQVLEHLSRPAGTVREIVRVLRPGGLLIVGVPTFPPGIAHLRAWIVGLLARCFGLKRAHVQTFTSRSFKAMVCAGHPLTLIACRGFRVASGGLLSWLEDYAWWYRVNRWIGRVFPWLCTEAQLVLSKKNNRWV